MGLLSGWFRAQLAAAFALVGLSAAGCSFVLDTDSLSSEQSGSAGATGQCNKVVERCADCLGKHCCTELVECTTAPLCAQALLKYQDCRNSTPGPACFTNFSTNGGARAANLATCGATRCVGECG